jgi:hypothetical protein
MKNFAARVFLSVSAAIFILEGAALLALRAGYFSIDDTAALYGYLVRTRDGMNLLSGFTMALFVIGLLFLHRVVRMAGGPDVIILKDKGGILRIPVDTFKDFIDQVLKKESLLSDFSTKVYRKGRWIYINITSNFTGRVHVCKEAFQVKHILECEIERVFKLSRFKITFQMKGIDAGKGQEDKRQVKNRLHIEEGVGRADDNEPEVDEVGIDKEPSRMPWER